MIQEIDRDAGKTVDKLEVHNLLNNTLIVFAADNGHSKHSPGSAGVYRDKKGKNYKGGNRAPIFFNWPGKIPAGTTSDALTLTLDLIPTFIDFCGAEIPAEIQLDGSSMKDHLICQSTFQERDIFWKGNGGNALRSKNWKLIHNLKSDKVELYDLHKDISESQNLAESHPEKVQKLLKKFKRWQESL